MTVSNCSVGILFPTFGEQTLARASLSEEYRVGARLLAVRWFATTFRRFALGRPRAKERSTNGRCDLARAWPRHGTKRVGEIRVGEIAPRLQKLFALSGKVFVQCRA